MAYYITEPLAGSNDIVVSVYKNTGEYVGNIICDRYKWRMSSDDDRDDVIRKCFGDKKWIWWNSEILAKSRKNCKYL